MTEEFDLRKSGKCNNFDLSKKSISLFDNQRRTDESGHMIKLNFYSEKDVKEFIRRLKKGLFREAVERGVTLDNSSLDRVSLSKINEEIDKLAGEELVSGESKGKEVKA